jgi:hypothetical protein
MRPMISGNPSSVSTQHKVCKLGGAICERETAPRPASPLVTKTEGLLSTNDTFPLSGDLTYVLCCAFYSALRQR